MRIAFLGYGNVGSAIATAVARAGHEVVLAVNPQRPDGAAAAQRSHPDLAAAGIAEASAAVRDADIVVLAVPFATLADLLTPLAGALTGKIVVDATNPVGPGLTHGLGSQEAGAQRVAGLIPGARVVKAFNTYGFENLSTPPAAVGDCRALMTIAGDDAQAKSDVAQLVEALGWEPLDAGPLAAALDMEHMALLWVRLVRVLGNDPHLVWSALRAPGEASER